MLNPALQLPGVLTVQLPLPTFVAQPTLLQRALSNLVGNALKFLTAGIPLRITIRAERRLHSVHPRSSGRSPFQPASSTHSSGNPETAFDKFGWVRIWVEDNGIGVAPENQGKIFGIFERLRSQEGYEGTGGGLAIVARAMQRRGGFCGVESQLGVGSRFWLELPAAEPAGNGG